MKYLLDYIEVDIFFDLIHIYQLSDKKLYRNAICEGECVCSQARARVRACVRACVWVFDLPPILATISTPKLCTGYDALMTHPAVTTQNGATALIAAAQSGHVEVARLLLESNASIHAADEVLPWTKPSPRALADSRSFIAESTPHGSVAATPTLDGPHFHDPAAYSVSVLCARAASRVHDLHFELAHWPRTALGQDTELSMSHTYSHLQTLFASPPPLSLILHLLISLLMINFSPFGLTFEIICEC